MNKLNFIILEGIVEYTPVWCGLGSGIEFYLIVGDSKFDVIARNALAESVSECVTKGAVLRIVGELYTKEGDVWVDAKHIEICKEDSK